MLVRSSLFALFPTRLIARFCPAGCIRRIVIRLPLIVILLIAPIAVALAQSSAPFDNISEFEIDALFGSGSSTTPVDTAGGTAPGSLTNLITLPSVYYPNGGYYVENSGWILSAALSLGNGRYLYAYQFSCLTYEFTVTQLSIPLGDQPLAPLGAVTTGAFVAGQIPRDEYGDPQGYSFDSAFAWFNQGLYWADQDTDPVTGVAITGDPLLPSEIVFMAPGDSPQALGLPAGCLVFNSYLWIHFQCAAASCFRRFCLRPSWPAATHSNRDAGQQQHAGQR